MDRQRLRVLSVLALFGCIQDSLPRHAFDGPGASAWLPANEGPFDEAVGFVANTRTGTIVPIDLKHATLLSDQLASPFLQPRWITTGDERQLGQLAAWAPDRERVTLFVADHVHQVLVEAPYVTGVDSRTGEPQIMAPTTSEVVFVDDGNGDQAELTELDTSQGFTTTEDWRVEFDETNDQWWVFGSRSGKQASTAKTGEPWHSDNHEISFTIEGTASEGDRFEFSTDTGVLEHDLGGYIMDLERVPDSSLLVVAIWQPVAESGDLMVWDMATGSAIGTIGMEESGQPWQLAVGTNDEGIVRVFAGLARRNAVQIVDLDIDSPESSLLTEIETTGPVSALSWVRNDPNPILEETEYDHLFVATTDGSRVDILDLRTQEWIDVNPHDDVVGGIELHSPVMGLSSSRVPVSLQEESTWGARYDDNIVAVTTFDGSIMMLEGRSGCLAVEEEGPTVPSTTTSSAIDFDDHGQESTPVLYQESATGESVVFSDCGGIARSEIWTFEYDGIEGNYIVEGSVTGLQENRAWEDSRYLSDAGEISLLILAGPAPTTDGDTFTLQVDDGVLRINQIIRPTGQFYDALELPAAPMVFDIESGPTGGGWDEDRTQAHIMVPVTNSDFVLRVDVDSWRTEVIWD